MKSFASFPWLYIELEGPMRFEESDSKSLCQESNSPVAANAI